VTCDVGNVTACLRPDERAVLKANPVDVEDWGMLTATFSDGTKATVFSGDMILGGVRNLIETHTSSGALFANITPNTHMMSYQTSEEKLAERLHHREGRSQDRLAICLHRGGMDARLRAGNPGFMECVATGRQPLSDLALAFETIRVNYAGYWAAEEGRRWCCEVLARGRPSARACGRRARIASSNASGRAIWASCAFACLLRDSNRPSRIDRGSSLLF
jgi:predicted dehydrogenase